MATGRARVESRFAQSVRNITAQPSGILGVVAVTERGPIATRTAITSPKQYDQIYGGLTASGTLAHLVQGFFDLGGTRMDVVRTTHFTDVTNPATTTAVAATLMLQNTGVAATQGCQTSTIAENYNLVTGDDLDFDVDGAPAGTATFTGTPATDTDTAVYPVGPLAGGETMGVKINGGAEQTITAAGGETTAADIALLLNGQLTQCSVGVSGGQVVITTDQAGTGASIEISTPGTLNPILGFPVGPVAGGGNVADITAVTGAECKTVIEAAIATLTVTPLGTGLLQICRTATGSTKSYQITGGTARTKIGLDLALHAGTDAGAVNTLQVNGKTEGTYAHALTIQIAAASNGSADYFNLYVLENGVAQETWVNVTMDTTATRYVQTVINHVTTGSNLIAVVDQLTGLPAADAKPATGTFGPMAAGNDGLVGLVDADFVGSATGPTGLYCLDTEALIRLVAIPGRASATIHAALNTYQTYRGDCYVIHPTPDISTVASADAMVTWATSNLYGTTEFGCIAWPQVRIANPDTTLFTDSDTYIEVDPCIYKAAKFQRNDRVHPHRIYTSAAGIDNLQGTLSNVIGLAAWDEVMDNGKRDRLSDVNVEPIVKFDNTPYHFDGGRNCKTDANWPRQWHARAALYITETIKAAWIAYKHVKNTPTMRREAARTAMKFIRADSPLEAWKISDGTVADIPAGEPLYYVDTSDALNPDKVTALGEFRAGIGLGFANDAEYIIIEVSRPTLPA